MNGIPEKHDIVKNIGFSLLEEGKTLRVKAEGYSMYPSIKPGSIILIEPIKKDHVPASGEVIAWKRESGFVVHRLVSTAAGEGKLKFITRGDSCLYADPPVTLENIAGKVVQVETRTGRILLSGDELIRNPVYLYNRLLVLTWAKLERIFTRKGTWL